jgi:hypothetical protein
MHSDGMATWGRPSGSGAQARWMLPGWQRLGVRAAARAGQRDA